MGKASRLKAERAAARNAQHAVDTSSEETQGFLGTSQLAAGAHDHPTNGFTLATTNRSREYGDFHTGLLYIGASTSDGQDREGARATVKVRDIVAAVPVLWWRLDTDLTHHQGATVMDAVGHRQSIAIKATLLDDNAFPMNSKRTDSVGFLFKKDTVQLVSNEVELGMFAGHQFKVDPRLGFFFGLSQTLSVVIETPSKTYVSTITADGGAPRLAIHDGTAHMKSLGQVVQRSTRWQPVHVGNVSILADAAMTPDHHRRTYAATSKHTDSPDELSKRSTCLACRNPGNSREHCVPKWIASDQSVPPVVAPLFCGACNNYFGKSLEGPVSKAYRSGKIASLLDEDVFHQWALKTSLLLSSASDVRFDESWMAELREGRMPEGFQIFALTGGRMDPGYLFSITHFSRWARDTGLFLFSFAIPDLLFVVLRHSESIEIPGLRRVLPGCAQSGQLAEIDVVELHDRLIERLTGHPMERFDTSLPTAPGPIRNTR